MNIWISDLSEYLDVPIIQIAYSRMYIQALPSIGKCSRILLLRGVAAEWKLDGVDRMSFSQQLYHALTAALTKAPRRTGDERSFVNFSDQPHWCSWTVNPALVDFIVDHFDDIVVLGKTASVPYLSDKAAEKGKQIHCQVRSIGSRRL